MSSHTDLRELERLAAGALANLAPLTFELAEAPIDRDAVLRMRYECVIEEGWARAEDFPDGRERDEHDDDAIFVLVRDTGMGIGSLRLVLPKSERLLPTERDFGIRARPLGQVPEVGRIIVAPAARARSHLVLGGLCARAWLEMSTIGYDRAISTAAPEVIGFYQSLGMHITVLGPSQQYWGTHRVPIQITGDEGSFAFLTH